MSKHDGSGRLSLVSGPRWSSLEEMIAAGEEAVSSLNRGAVGGLTTDSGTYRVLAEDDFQTLLGLAQDVSRLSTAVNDLVAAAQVASEQQDDDSLRELIAAASQVRDVPALALRQGHAALVHEHMQFNDDDGLITDAAELRALLKRRNS